jgi:hypothetical protein
MAPAHTKILSKLLELDRLSSLLVRRSGVRNSAHRPLLPRFHADEVFAPYALIYARVFDETARQQFTAAMAQIESIAVANWPIQFSASNEALSTPTRQICDSV